MDDFFMRTHKIHKGSNVGEWVSPQSQQIFVSSTSPQTPRLDDPFIANMKNKMEDLEQENQLLKQQQKDLQNETKRQLDENNAKMDIMSQKMNQILQHFDIRLP